MKYYRYTGNTVSGMLVVRVPDPHFDDEGEVFYSTVRSYPTGRTLISSFPEAKWDEITEGQAHLLIIR